MVLATIEDLWSGLWGYVRIWGEQNESLQKLPDRPVLTSKVRKDRVQKMRKGGETLIKARGAGNSCPQSAPVKKI